MKLRTWMLTPLWNAEGQAAAGGNGQAAPPPSGVAAAAAAAAQQGGQGQQQGQAQGQQQSGQGQQQGQAQQKPASVVDAAAAAAAAAQPADGQPYYPEGLDEKLRGKTERETLDNVARVLAERRPPASANDYKLDLPADLKDIVGDLSGDPAFKAFRDSAHKHGLSQGQFSAVLVDIYQTMAKEGLISKPIDPYEVIDSLGKAGERDQQVRRRQGSDRVNGVSLQLKELADGKKITPEERNMALALMNATTGVTLLEKLLAPAREHGVQGGGLPGGVGRSRDDLNRAMADPRYSTTSDKHDPAFRKQVDEEWRRLPRGQPS